MLSLKKEEKNSLAEIEDLNRRRSNAINKFLNLYFKYIAVFIIFVVLWGGFRFFIKPRFDEAMALSGTSTKQKKSEFITAYNKMEEYSNVLDEYSEVDKEKINKIIKMVPEEYSRDDLFTEITYFLIQNNYKIDNISVVNPMASESQPDLEADAPAGRRTTTQAESSVESAPHINYIKALPSGIGSWFITVNLSNTDYPDLKRLLNLLESNLKLMDVFSVDFEPTSNTATISILTYYQKN